MSQIRSQTVLEFMITYSWALIIVLLMVAVLAYYTLFPSSIAPPICSFASGFACTDILVTTNSLTHNTIMYINMSNQQTSPVYNVTVKVQLSDSNKNTSSAQCYPAFVPAGASVYCVLSLSIHTNYYQDVTGELFVNSSQCGLAINYTSNGSCIGASPSTDFGSFNAHATRGSKFAIGTIYCVGTASTSPYNYSYYSTLYDDGSMGSWSPTTSYPEALEDASCDIDSGYIYCTGGYNGVAASTSSYFAPLSSTGIGSWNTTTPYPIGLDYAGCVQQDSITYCIGTNSTPPYNYDFVSSLSGAGIGQWRATASYPIDNNSNSCSIYDGYIYCVGTSLGSRAKSAYSAPIYSGGVGAWMQTTSFPDTPNSGCVASNGYIYCVAYAASCGHHCTAVGSYYAPISGGEIGAWTSTTAYPTGLYDAGCNAYDGEIYCVGSNQGSAQSVYYASLSANGIGAWASGPSYPIALYGAYCAVAGSGVSYFG